MSLTQVRSAGKPLSFQGSQLRDTDPATKFGLETLRSGTDTPRLGTNKLRMKAQRD
jgi:hypothetical protein